VTKQREAQDVKRQTSPSAQPNVHMMLAPYLIIWFAERSARLMPENAANLEDEAVGGRWGENRD
jgi:hypothetical protein